MVLPFFVVVLGFLVCLLLCFYLLNTNIMLITSKFLNAYLVEIVPSSEKEVKAILHEVKIKQRLGH